MLVTSTPKNIHKDCVFVAVPYTDTDKPLMAPAILKSIAIKAGKSAATVDVNIKFIKYLDKLTDEKRHQILSFFRAEICHLEVQQEIFDLLKDMAEEILRYQPKIVGICVFTRDCRCATKYLSWMLKKIDPNIKIILGGAGIIQHFAGHANFAADLKKSGVIDDFVYGDGEIVLYNYLKNIQSDMTGLNNHAWDQISRQDLESFPPPDYEDYDLSQYGLPLALPINGSRGCVRHCDFCDIHAHWKKFTYRGGENIFQEMLLMRQKHGIKYFNFTDSLINGNMREYRVLMNLIADYNRNKSDDEKFKWSSYFIFRDKKTFGEEDWRLTSEGGGDRLFVGIETISDHARKQMGKNFTNEDIDYAFQMGMKFKTFTFVLLMLSGHVAETDEDHEFELQWWPNQVKYKNAIAAINTGTTLGILDNTPLDKNFNELGLIRVGPYPEDWVNPVTDNTPEKRLRWNQEVYQVLKNCGFRILRGHDPHYILERMRNTTNGLLE